MAYVLINIDRFMISMECHTSLPSLHVPLVFLGTLQCVSCKSMTARTDGCNVDVRDDD